MINVAIPEEDNRRLPFYLAAEEWVAHNLPAGDYFFAWRVKPTVICGRHQEIDKEVNLAFCKDNGIDVVRRRSGGGTVFADRNNWMFSYITPGDSIDTTFAHYTGMIADTLKQIGFNAVPTGRNDILINGAKVAGNAFYHIPGRSIVHGTMLLEIDAVKMSQAITPSRAKLESKGVKSVTSRVTSLRACGLTMSAEDFGAFMVNALCETTITLTEPEILQIKELERRYYEPDFLRLDGVKTSGTRIRKRIEGVGTVCADIVTSDAGKIENIRLSGDFFGDANAVSALEQSLRGLTKEDLRELILTQGSPIVGMDAGELATTLTE